MNPSATNNQPFCHVFLLTNLFIYCLNVCTKTQFVGTLGQWCNSSKNACSYQWWKSGLIYGTVRIWLRNDLFRVITISLPTSIKLRCDGVIYGSNAPCKLPRIKGKLCTPQSSATGDPYIAASHECAVIPYIMIMMMTTTTMMMIMKMMIIIIIEELTAPPDKI